MGSFSVQLLLVLFLFMHVAIVSPQQEETDWSEGRTADNAICNEIFQKLQLALVSNEANLYGLREIFFPSSKPPPTLLNVSYEITFSNLSQTACSNIDNQTVDPPEILFRNRGWTSQSLYTQIHPVVVNRLQPQFLYHLMILFEPRFSTSGTIEASLRWQGLQGEKFLTLSIFLNLDGLLCTPTLEQMDNSLDDLTSVLQEIAETQQIITEWTSRDVYVLDGNVFDAEWWLYHCEIYGNLSCYVRHLNFLGSFLLSLVFMVVVPVLLHYKGPKKGKVENGKYKIDPGYDFGHSLLWNTFGVSIILCPVGFMTEFILVCLWISTTSQTQEAIFFFWILVYSHFALLSSAFTNFLKLRKIDLLTPSHAVFNGVFCGMRWDILVCLFYQIFCEEKCTALCTTMGNCYKNHFKKKCIKRDDLKGLLGTWLLFTLYCMIFYIILCLLPVVLFFLLHPDRVSAFYIYITSALAFLIFSYTAADFERRIRKNRHVKKHLKKEMAGKEQTDSDSIEVILKSITDKLRKKSIHKSLCKLKGYFFVFISFMALLFTIVVTGIFVVLYHSIVAQGHSDNVLLTLIKAFIPAILFSSPLWLKKWLKHHYRLDKSTDSENNDSSMAHNLDQHNKPHSTPKQQSTQEVGNTEKDPQNTDNTDSVPAPGNERESTVIIV